MVLCIGVGSYSILREGGCKASGANFNTWDWGFCKMYIHVCLHTDRTCMHACTCMYMHVMLLNVYTPMHACTNTLGMGSVLVLVCQNRAANSTEKSDEVEAISLRFYGENREYFNKTRHVNMLFLICHVNDLRE